MTANPPPTPVATDEAGFVAELRRLRTWSGRSFRQLERRASAAGDSLPFSTAATMLGRNRLPRAELLETFVRACGLDEDDLGHWVRVRARIADGTAVAPRPRVGTWRRLAVVGVAALAFAGGVGFAVAVGGESTVEHEYVDGPR